MADPVTAINILWNTYKTVKELYEKADNIELQKHILLMNEQIVEAKQLTIDLKNENLELKEEVRKLKSLSEKRLTMIGGVYYEENDNTPYCPNCYNNDKELRIMNYALTNDTDLRCPKCHYMGHGR